MIGGDLNFLRRRVPRLRRRRRRHRSHPLAGATAARRRCGSARGACAEWPRCCRTTPVEPEARRMVTFEEDGTSFPCWSENRVPQRRHVRTDAARSARRRRRGAAAGRPGGAQRPAPYFEGCGPAGYYWGAASPTWSPPTRSRSPSRRARPRGGTSCSRARARLLGRDRDDLRGALRPAGALSVFRRALVVVEPGPDAIRAAVTPRTRLLALSQVLWTTGGVLPVRELRGENRVPFLSTAPSRSARSRSRRRRRLPHDLGPEMAVRSRLHGRTRRRGAGGTPRGSRPELLLAGGL